MTQAVRRRDLCVSTPERPTMVPTDERTTDGPICETRTCGAALRSARFAEESGPKLLANRLCWLADARPATLTWSGGARVGGGEGQTSRLEERQAEARG